MKLLRSGGPGQEKPGVLDRDSQIRDLSHVVRDITGTTLFGETLQRLRITNLDTLPLIPSGVRIGPCVADVGKFICIGLNYADRAAESGAPVPRQPVIFMKATSAICGPNDDVVIPRGSSKSDWEVELGVVIGKSGKYVSESDALSHVAGYCVINDLSEVSFSLRVLASG